MTRKFGLKRQVTIIADISMYLTIFMVIYKPKSCPGPPQTLSCLLFGRTNPLIELALSVFVLRSAPCRSSR